MEFWSGLWSGMESDFEFLAPFHFVLRLTERQAAKEWSGAEFEGNQ